LIDVDLQNLKMTVKKQSDAMLAEIINTMIII